MSLCRLLLFPARAWFQPAKKNSLHWGPITRRPSFTLMKPSGSPVVPVAVAVAGSSNSSAAAQLQIATIRSGGGTPPLRRLTAETPCGPSSTQARWVQERGEEATKAFMFCDARSTELDSTQRGSKHVMSSNCSRGAISMGDHTTVAAVIGDRPPCLLVSCSRVGLWAEIAARACGGKERRPETRSGTLAWDATSSRRFRNE